ncbi:MAG: BMP family ABC transporter substrate-binding protein [Clostridiales bacterium]|nr:BMP family ABC transporter substrate-binding protein [Clostridiales bacterium]
MSKTEYEKARRKAQKTYRAQLLRGAYPYLQALDDIVSFAGIASEVDLGLMEIPLDAIAGTKTTGRQQAFASNFMPLLDEHSEFARKWIDLFNAHMEEGIRDPVTAVEFMNRFYIIEGNKRVSVLKYVDAVSIQAYVTRLIPQRNDSPENRIYYEFLDFYKVSSVNYLTFSQEGCYAKLLNILGKSMDEPWTEDEKLNFRSSYIHFLDVFEEKGGRKLSITSGDAFLTYVEIYGYEDILDKSYQQLREEIPAIWKDFEIFPAKRSIRLVTTPDNGTEDKTLVSRILPFSSAPVRIGFVHDRSSEESSWTYSHELGRHYVEDILSDRVITASYVNLGTPEDSAETIQAAVDDGCTIIFTTSPKLLSASVKAALRNPSIRILNCSLNSCFGHLRTYYGRMYEGKFLTGILAGILSPEDSIGYLADYPIYGSTASINAFALGVRMVNPKARVFLEWSCVRDNHIEEYFDARRISYVSGQDLLSPSRASRQFGLYDIRGGNIQNIAMPVWHWGKFYERIIRSILNGTWKKGTSKDQSINYFWGLSSGMIDVICSKHVPSETVQLIEMIKKAISSGQFHPFSGEIHSQDGTLQNKNGVLMSEEQIGSMDWLLDNVYGSFPALDTMTDEAKRIVKLQGVGKYQEL